MGMVNIYMNPKGAAEDSARVADIMSWFGFPRCRTGSAPCIVRHNFYQRHGGFPIGKVVVPIGAEIVQHQSGTTLSLPRVLRVPTRYGIIDLSAADVLEQARVGGCGLKLVDDQ